MKEEVNKIYKRTQQYCLAIFGEEADEIHLLDDGDIKAVYHKYCRGPYTEEEIISADCLTKDLEVVYEERKKAEEEKRQKELLEAKKIEQLKKEAELERRKKQYLELKKEFEPES